jgi:hypothetical protein
MIPEPPPLRPAFTVFDLAHFVSWPLGTVLSGLTLRTFDPV